MTVQKQMKCWDTLSSSAASTAGHYHHPTSLTILSEFKCRNKLQNVYMKQILCFLEVWYVKCKWHDRKKRKSVFQKYASGLFPFANANLLNLHTMVTLFIILLTIHCLFFPWKKNGNRSTVNHSKWWYCSEVCKYYVRGNSTLSEVHSINIVYLPPEKRSKFFPFRLDPFSERP